MSVISNFKKQKFSFMKHIYSCLKGITLSLAITTSGFGAITRQTYHPRSAKDGILRTEGELYHLNGKEFVEIGWNKFDLFWSLWEEESKGRRVDDPNNAMVQKQDLALQELSQLGFNTIRFFATPFAGRQFHTELDQRETYYRIMDTIVAMLEKHQISACLCLGLKQFNSREFVWFEEENSHKWVFGEEHERELLADKNSKSRQYAYEFLETIIPRYKDSPAILMWEISNEFTNNVDIMPETKEYNGERKGTLGHSLNSTAMSR